ncbi:MAG: ATP-binding protein [Anaerolineales bacterium]
MSSQETSFKPYARLLTMLGDQLIKNEQIALVELIKNSYDADADWVKISFNNFGDNFETNDDSSIVIEDNGKGMTLDEINNVWMRPATPNKVSPNREEKFTTEKGRVIQGEKGIGRFAILKMGKYVKITTRPQKQENEYLLTYDFEKYDDDFLSENGVKKDIFLDDLHILLESRKPKEIQSKKIKLGGKTKNRSPHGTKIEIKSNKINWTKRKIENVQKQVNSINAGYASVASKKQNDLTIQIYFYKDDELLPFQEEKELELNQLLENYPVFKITDGEFDDKEKSFSFQINGIPKKITLDDPLITGLSIYRNRFIETQQSGDKINVFENRLPECGPFNFEFYVFDFSNNADKKYFLSRQQKDIIKEHRIYLYRDDIRVFPYGEPDNDWLQIDVFRGTIAAGSFLSNDQVVGNINISRLGNPKLKDKTNREGLIEEGEATSDFIGLIQVFLSYIKQHPYNQYRQKLKSRETQVIFQNKLVEEKFIDLKDKFKSDKKITQIINDVENTYQKERLYLVERAEVTEDLAAVGLSVETASHDILLIMHRFRTATSNLVQEAIKGPVDSEFLIGEVNKIEGMASFIHSQLENIQTLFRSAKRRPRRIKVEEILEKVFKIFEKDMKKLNIQYKPISKGPPLFAKCTDALLMQLFLNLFDNSLYWLQEINKSDKEVRVTMDGDARKLIFSDNGPGVHEDDIPYIFEPFYSGKGDEGRGLGLYISRQLLERVDYSIDLADTKNEKILSGANFVVWFLKGE